ncbi:MAG: T9SS type A sorting domain-containing protein [Sporocytophaga sp.]|nr:T9SS type A sorting domain-containing protein [Sporocytophaga sp.]
MKRKYFSLVAGIISCLFFSNVFAQCPTLDAGPDQDICSNNEEILFDGGVSDGIAKVKWSTTGTGTFSNPNAIRTTYTPSSEDINKGSISVILSALEEACEIHPDTAIITFYTMPIADAGDEIVPACVGVPTQLHGVANNATDVLWSFSGSGRFLTPTNSFDTQYIPSENDQKNGSVVLSFMASNKGCNSSIDRVKLTFPEKIVDAGLDESVCANAVIKLTGTSVATKVLWTTNGQGKFSDENSLSTTYIPSASDINTGSVILNLQSPGNGCFTASDSKRIGFIVSKVQASKLGASLDTTICWASSDPYPLDGLSYVLNAEWATTGTGLFSADKRTLKNSYQPSTLDILLGKVELILKTPEDINCPNADTISARLSWPSVANAGVDKVVRIEEEGIQLSGAIIENRGFKWVSRGTGAFYPNNNTTLRPVYIPSEADRANGRVTIELRPDYNNICAVITDAMTISFVRTDLHKISGSIFLQNKVKASETLVILFKLAGSKYIVKDSLHTQSGEYTFENIEAGTYLIHAKPMDPIERTFYTPTYLGNVTKWTNAYVINLNSTDQSSNDIHLVPLSSGSSGWKNGKDNIAGVVGDENLYLGQYLIGGTVCLRDSVGTTLECTETNEIGMFMFQNIAKGRYSLSYDYPGYESLINTLYVEGDPSVFTADNPSLKRVSFVTNLLGENATLRELQVYPNPAFDYIHLNIENKRFEYAIINSIGDQIVSNNIENGEPVIDLQNLKHGVYIIKVIQDGNFYKAKIYKK